MKREGEGGAEGGAEGGKYTWMQMTSDEPSIKD